MPARLSGIAGAWLGEETAIYVDRIDEKGWFYSNQSSRYKVRAPDGSRAILDGGKDAENPPGWQVEKVWMNFYPEYTITAPNGDVMSFGDDWNA